MEFVAVSTVFAIALTKIVDFARNAFDKDDQADKWVWNVTALGLGALGAYTLGLNVFDNLGVSNATNDDWGRIFTGLAIGATGSGWHEILDLASSAAKGAKPEPEPNPQEEGARSREAS